MIETIVKCLNYFVLFSILTRCLTLFRFLLSQLHFVSYNTKYADILDALNHEDGLAVLGVFIQVGNMNAIN